MSTIVERKGYFGDFGGSYVPEVLRSAIDDLDAAFGRIRDDASFWDELAELHATYTGRPTPLLHAQNAGRAIGGADIYIKVEGLANTGAHKVNNAAGQVLLAKRMGKRRIIAETGAGQHGLATAAVCAKLGVPCTVYMGEVDVARQRPNVFMMELFGAEVVPVTSGARTLKDAVNEAMRDWAASYEDTHYIIGSALGPAPFPDMVREFQAIIGRELVDQLAARNVQPEALVACVGGGSNAIGFFEPFLTSEHPRLIGVEAGGRGTTIGDHAARMCDFGRTGIVHGYKSLFLLDDDGQVQATHSVSAGLDYPGIGPQLAYLGSSGRVEFRRADDDQALEALRFFAAHEGLVFALECAHGAYQAMQLARELGPGASLVVNMSGRGDKDLFITARNVMPEVWERFLRHEADAIAAARVEHTR